MQEVRVRCIHKELSERHLEANPHEVDSQTWRRRRPIREKTSESHWRVLSHGIIQQLQLSTGKLELTRCGWKSLSETTGPLQDRSRWSKERPKLLENMMSRIKWAVLGVFQKSELEREPTEYGEPLNHEKDNRYHVEIFDYLPACLLRQEGHATRASMVPQ